MLNDALSIFATIIGLLGLAGGAVGYFAKGRGDSIIAYQAKQIELYKDDITRLEKTVATVTAERDLLQRQNDEKNVIITERIVELAKAVEQRHNR